MSEDLANRKRQFRCQHCNGLIVIPWTLPPTKGPCPHCRGEILSPAPPEAGPVEPARKASPPMPVAVTEVKEKAAVSPPPPAPAPMPAPEPVVQEEPVPEAKPPALSAVPVAPTAAKLDEPEDRREEPPAVPVLEEVPELADRPIIEEPRRRRGIAGRLLAVAAAVVLVGGALTAAYYVAKGQLPVIPQGGEKVDEAREEQIRRSRYLRVGWRDDARDLLERFVHAPTIEEKAVCAIGGAALLPEMMEYYGDGDINDRDTPSSAFSCFDLRLEDRERGLFLMIYDRPSGFELSEFFRPLAPIEVQYGLESPDMLLASFARASNFVQEPVRVMAFFKETDDGLKLDWHVFVQTKERLLRDFLFSPRPGRRGVFRMSVSEDVPEGGRGESGMRTYRLDDPIHGSDSVRVKVPVDSEVGRVLSAVNWRGQLNEPNQARTATLELVWRGEDDPAVEISRFICWEFLGLGGDTAATAVAHE